MARLQSASTGAVTAAAFDASMTPFRVAPGARIAVAVSGGSDSMALVGLLADWVRARDVQLHALTIDHRLRDAAAGEAAQVAAWLAAARVPHTILTWEEGRAARDVKRSAQSAARAARYRLMTGWCTAHDCTHLFVAHHADDQVETFFQRLARGSGVDGLAAMAPAIMRDGIVIARPLLAFPKGMLEQVCRDLGQPWIEDPSNASTASGRVRFRQARDVLAREGLTRERLLATVAHLQRARAALDHAVAGLLGEAVWDAYGAVRLPVAALLSVPEEIGLRTLARLLMGVSGQEFGPRFENLARLYARITVGPWRDATLHGAVVSREGTDLVIAREPAQVGEDKTLTADNSVIWDGRFKLTLTAAVPMCFTVTGCAAVRDVTESGTSALSKVPARARSVIPALIDSHGLAAIPHTGYMRADVAALEGLSLALVQLSRTRAGVEPPDAKL